MTIQITIVGMGQIGTSIGLALADHTDKLKRVGHDRNMAFARQAQKMGALDSTAMNLPKSVRDADIVLLALPVDQIQETLELIAPELREDAVVMDTGPVKEVVAAWAGELFPEKRHYVGLTPVINPQYLHGVDSGIEAAHGDLFRKGMVAIVAPPRTASEAIKLAADLTRLLGADPLFVDPLEIDSFMAATHTLPQLMAVALLNSTIDQPGWREARKVAGRAYAEVTSPCVQFSEPKALGRSAILNRENVLRAVDGVIAALQTVRTDIENEDGESLESRLERALQGRERWWLQRQAADWVSEEMADTSVDSMSRSDMVGRLFGYRSRKKPDDKKD
jgi:prephenate dehydrogenase